MLRLKHIELAEANEFVAQVHRHHKPVTGHRFSIGAVDAEGNLRGIAIIGRPVARALPQKEWVEVTRLATDGTRDACSFLYGAAARAAKALGYEHIHTYILDTEPGTSLRAAGWSYELTTEGETWDRPNRQRVTADHLTVPKKRYGKYL